MYIFRGNNWLRLKQNSPPSKRRGHTSVITKNNQLVIFGGKNTNTCLKDIYVSDSINMTAPSNTTIVSWTKKTLFPGDCRWGHSSSMVMTVDGDEMMAVFGGRLEKENSTSSFTYYNVNIIYIISIYIVYFLMDSIRNDIFWINSTSTKNEILTYC